MNGIEFDPSQTGLQAILKEWQVEVMRIVWNTPQGVNSRAAWTQLNQVLKTRTISRASVINFLESMREMGVLDADERTGKGGHFYIYKMGMDEASFKRYVAETILTSLIRDFPQETQKAIQNTT